jgi:hypothetical protein
LRPAGAKNSPESISTDKKLGMVAHIYHPSYRGRISVQACLSTKKQDSIQKITEAKELRAQLKW